MQSAHGVTLIRSTSQSPNPTPGLQVSGGWYGFTVPKPALILVSSAATERNALFADVEKRDVEARKADIPIVQLNPGGVLNYKYDGEQAVRALGLPYTVIRPVGGYCLNPEP